MEQWKVNSVEELILEYQSFNPISVNDKYFQNLLNRLNGKLEFARFNMKPTPNNHPLAIHPTYC